MTGIREAGFGTDQTAGTQVSYEMTEDGMITTITDPLGNQMSEAENLAGLTAFSRDTARGEDGEILARRSVCYEYDAKGRLETTTYENNAYEHNNYDTSGHLIATVYHDVNGSETMKTVWRYDSRAGRMPCWTTAWKTGPNV